MMKFQRVGNRLAVIVVITLFLTAIVALSINSENVLFQFLVKPLGIEVVYKKRGLNPPYLNLQEQHLVKH